MPDAGLPLLLTVAFAFAFGAILGSFANVCIHRLPRGESVVLPRSRCPGCGTPILPSDNVPVLSWFLLRGRCRACARPISPRYALVEAAGGALVVLALFVFGPTGDAAGFVLLGAAALVLVPTDLSHRVLPDEVTLGALVLALALSLARDLSAAVPPGGGPRFARLLASLLGAAAGAGILLAVRAFYQRVRGVEGMGLGDVKMLAMVGAVTGPAGVLVTLLLSSLSGAAAGALLALLRAVSWRQALRSGPSPADSPGGLPGGGALLGSDRRVVATGRRWDEVPGAPSPGERGERPSLPTARPLCAFVRLSLRRAASGRETASGRLVLDDGEDFFRVLAARAVPRNGGLLVLLARADIPFGVFLAFGSIASYAFGRALLSLLLGIPDPPGALLLP